MTTENQDASDAQRNQQKKEAPWYIEIPVVLLLTFFIIFLFHTFIGRLYVIPSASMEPTLHGCEGCTGDRIFVDKITYRLRDPEPGDVVVFKGTGSWNEGYVSQRSENPVIRGVQNGLGYVGLVAPDENDLVKRIIAVGGQTVQCLAGDPGIMVDGKEVDSSYIQNPPAYPTISSMGSEACGGEYFGPVTIPEDHIWVMGDNRTNSRDSRWHMGDELQGTVPEDNIRGKVDAIVFPFNRIGIVESYNIQENPSADAAA